MPSTGTAPNCRGSNRTATSTRRTGTPTNGPSRPEVRVTGLETIHVRAALSAPRGPSVLTYRARESLFVKLTTDTGLVGWGETYAMAGVRAAIDGLGPLLVGSDPLAARHLLRELRLATFDNGFVVGG